MSGGPEAPCDKRQRMDEYTLKYTANRLDVIYDALMATPHQNSPATLARAIEQAICEWELVKAQQRVHIKHE